MLKPFLLLVLISYQVIYMPLTLKCSKEIIKKINDTCMTIKILIISKTNISAHKHQENSDKAEKPAFEMECQIPSHKY